MNTEHHNADHAGGHPPTNPDVNFESADINTRTILTYLIYLAISVIAAFVISVYVFRYATKSAVDSETALPPSRQGVAPTKPPEPMLQGVPGHQTDAQQDLRDRIAADEAENNKLEWVNPQAGIARIPVSEAMKIIAEKGLPGVSAAPTEKKK